MGTTADRASKKRRLDADVGRTTAVPDHRVVVLSSEAVPCITLNVSREVMLVSSSYGRIDSRNLVVNSSRTQARGHSGVHVKRRAREERHDWSIAGAARQLIAMYLWVRI